MGIRERGWPVLDQELLYVKGSLGRHSRGADNKKTVTVESYHENTQRTEFDCNYQRAE